MFSAKYPSGRLYGRALLQAALWLIPISGAAIYLLARTRMDPLVSTAMLYHAGAGAVLGTWYVISLRRRPKGAVVRVSLTASLATGVALIAAAALGVSVSRLPWVVTVHIALGFVILVGLIVLTLRRFVARKHPTSPAVTAAMIIASTTAVLAATGLDYPAEDYYRRLTATNPSQAGNPLFPAWTLRGDGADWSDARGAQSCGVTGCHPDIHRQWSGTRHARSAESIPTRRDSESRWCRGCHATAALLTDPQSAERRAHAGVDCVACHAMADVPHPTGNGLAVYTPPARYPFAAASAPIQQRAHAFLLRLRPAPHIETLRPLRSRDDANLTCAPCHRMAVNVAQNHYKFLRYDNTWADWQAGPFSRESLHAFQSSPMRRDCIDCHMPRDANGRVDHSGRVSSAKLTRNRDLRVEVFALRRQGGPAGSETLDAPLEDRKALVSPGADIVVDVLVENRGIGHAFPAATETGDDVWLAFTVKDATGRPLISAPARPNTSDDTAHRYGQLSLDRNGNPLSPALKSQVVAEAYRRFIGPGEADIAHYRLTVPPSVSGGILRLSARLLRKHPLRDGAAVEVLADHSVIIEVRSGTAPSGPGEAPINEPLYASRFYAYGVGLLLQGDNGRARRMFLQASRLVPREPLYDVGAARAYLAEHDLLSARASLDSALRNRPNMPEALAWLGAVYRESGQYAKGLAVLTPLASRYPRDRHLWMEIGLCRLQSGEDAAAAEAFQAALVVDPDDAAAHYNLMQSRVRLRQISQARREETIFRALQDDEPLRSILDPYYAIHPGARIESLPLHQHLLQPKRRGVP